MPKFNTLPKIITCKYGLKDRITDLFREWDYQSKNECLYTTSYTEAIFYERIRVDGGFTSGKELARYTIMPINNKYETYKLTIV